MNNLEHALIASKSIRRLASRAIRQLHAPSAAWNIAHGRYLRPVDYMRYAEFEAVLRNLRLEPGMKVLDVGSPQWFSLYLADRHPDVKFLYTNILDEELDGYREIAQAIGLENICFRRVDARKMPFGDGEFDRVLSISVIEHVYPACGGDTTALHEIRRVVKNGGQFLLTIPYKSESHLVYTEGPVYERKSRRKGKNFFAREYDAQTLAGLCAESGFDVEATWFLCERTGFFSPDYYQWGPGRHSKLGKFLVLLRQLVERIARKDLASVWAGLYLSVVREPVARLVNIALVLTKPER